MASRALERSMYREFHFGKPSFRVFSPDGKGGTYCRTWVRGTGDFEGEYLGGYLDNSPGYTRSQHFYEERRKGR